MLEALGWDSDRESEFETYAADGLVPGRVAIEHRSAYVVYTATDELRAEASGRLRHEAGGHGDLPAVGDWVALAPAEGDGHAIVQAVLPRRTKFSRKVALSETDEQVVAANVDVVFLLQALNGDVNVRRLERYLTMAWESGATPAILLTKADLCDDVAQALLEVEAVAFDVPVHVVSSVTGDGLDEVRSYFTENRTGALLGSSGVGKSTLINTLVGHELLATAEVRESDGRGRHTTSHRELVLLPGGGLVLDTPGMRELQLWEGNAGLDEAFADVEALAAECRFNDCAHRNEPGCAVLAALESGALAADRLASYRKLERELYALKLKQDARLRSEEVRKRRIQNRAARVKAFRKQRGS